jgi:dTMP kinase
MLRAALAGRNPVVVREPGGTRVGERVRELLLHGGVDFAPEAEMLLYMASRAQLVAEVIGPALEAGRLVIADRYHDTTLAYQGGGRGLDTWWPKSFPKPDRTILLRLPDPEAGFNRLRLGNRQADRLESAGLDFHHRVVEAYDRLAAAEPMRWIVLDAQLPPDDLHEQVMAAVDGLLVAVR